MSKIVVAVGYYFSMLNQEDVQHINLREAGRIKVNGEYYYVHKGTSFEESEKVDALLNEVDVEFDLDDFPVHQNIYLYDVTDYRLHMGDTNLEWDIDKLNEFPNFRGFADEQYEFVRCEGKLEGLKEFDFNIGH